MKRLFSVLVLLLLSITHSANTYSTTFTVNALNNSSPGSGLNTGINLSSGEIFSVTADPSDLWSAGALPRWSNADGLVGNLFATGSDESGEVINTLIGADFGLLTQFSLSAPYGSLVGELSGTYFLLGSNFSGAAPASGVLSLYYWDDGNLDNGGSISVDVQVAANSVPEPITLWLLGLGMLSAMTMSRKK